MPRYGLARRIWRLALLALMLLAAPAPGECEQVYKLGMSAAFTGPSKGLGIELYRGSMAYFEHLNKHGGINGRLVEIKAYDDAYEPAAAIENTIRFLERDNIDTLFNYVGTPTVTRVLPIIKSYHARRVYLFFPFTGAQPQREAPYDEYVFNLRASYRKETEGLVDNLVSIGRTRIAVFYQVDAYGRSGWDGVRRALLKYGLEICSEATYKRGAPYEESMARQVEILKESRPDAVISVGSYAACASFIRDARDNGLDVPIANLSFVGSENLLALLEATGRQKKKNYCRDLINSQVVPSYEDLSIPAVREYRELMDEADTGPPPGYEDTDYTPLKYSFVSFEGFFNAKVMARILEEADRSRHPGDIAFIAESLPEIDVGLETTISFSSSRHDGLGEVYYTTVHEGKFMPITDWSKWKK